MAGLMLPEWLELNVFKTMLLVRYYEAVHFLLHGMIGHCVHYFVIS